MALRRLLTGRWGGWRLLSPGGLGMSFSVMWFRRRLLRWRRNLLVGVGIGALGVMRRLVSGAVRLDSRAAGSSRGLLRPWFFRGCVESVAESL